MYPEEMVKPMQAELTTAGFQDLHSAEAVENAMKLEGTTLVVVIRFVVVLETHAQEQMSLEGGKTRPFNHCFAGVDKDAVDAKTTHVPFSSIIISMACSKTEN
jgi:putative YphP/YqiW family bacilliredoxin